MVHGGDWSVEEIDEILEELRPVTIPVSISVEGRQRVLSLDEAERVLKSAGLISLERCSCRERIKGCDGPLDVCVCAGGQAEEAIAERGAWQTTFEAAMDDLRRSHEAGLVHLAYETRARGRIEIICSCCASCCQTLVAITRLGYNRDIIGHSDVIATLDRSLCNDCGLCVPRCHFKAWSELEGEVVLDQGRRSGCGVCVSFYPNGATRLVSRE